MKRYLQKALIIKLSISLFLALCLLEILNLLNDNWLAIETSLGINDPEFWPTLFSVLSMEDYNTKVVLLGVMVLGLTGGVIGSFMLLRKRALISDAVSHATLPGICLAFLIMTSLMGNDGKNLLGLLTGALLSGLLGMGCMIFLKHYTRLKEDTVLGIILSVFFGAGAALAGIVQRHPLGQAAGLNNFIFGKPAAMQESDVWLLSGAALMVLIICILLYKEFKLLCFDQNFAGAQGWPIILLDIILMSLVVAVTVIGLQAVGIIMVIAMLIIPASAARFWTEDLFKMVIISGIIGTISGYLGAALSGVINDIPAGATIVLVTGICFMFSMIFGTKRGVLFRVLRQYRLSQRVQRQNLLRTMFEWFEANPMAEKENRGISFGQLIPLRSWTAYQLAMEMNRAIKEGIIAETTDENWRLTALGKAQASLIVRNHRLWEIYLITHADIATSRVDRETDMIEHILGVEMVQKLENIVAREYPHVDVPPSPHPIQLNKEIG